MNSFSIFDSDIDFKDLCNKRRGMLNDGYWGVGPTMILGQPTSPAPTRVRQKLKIKEALPYAQIS